MVDAQTAAYFSNDVYNDTDWLEGPDAAVLGLPGWSVAADSGVYSDGFEARAYHNSSTGETVIAYRGTDYSESFGTGAGDVYSDVQLGLGIYTGQATDAVQFFDQVASQSWFDATNAVTTGHSLGAALAAIATASSSSVDKPTFAIVFGPGPDGPVIDNGLADAALSLDATFASANILNYVNVNDAVPGLTAGDDYGSFSPIDLGTFYSDSDLTSSTANVVSYHSMGIYGLYMKYGDQMAAEFYNEPRFYAQLMNNNVVQVDDSSLDSGTLASELDADALISGTPVFGIMLGDLEFVYENGSSAPINSDKEYNTGALQLIVQSGEDGLLKRLDDQDPNGTVKPIIHNIDSGTVIDVHLMSDSPAVGRESILIHALSDAGLGPSELGLTPADLDNYAALFIPQTGDVTVDFTDHSLADGVVTQNVAVIGSPDGNSTITGTPFDDLMIGGSGTNYFHTGGGTGNDIMVGGPSDNWYYFGSTDDGHVKIFDEVHGGVNTIAAADDDTTITLNQQLQSAGIDAIDGQGHSGVILSLPGDPSGNIDVSNYKLSDLTVIGTPGDDTFVLGDPAYSNVTLQGAGGSDTVAFNTHEGISATYDSGTLSLSDTPNGNEQITLDGINTITGSTHNDFVAVSGDNMTVNGGGGADNIIAHGDNDTLSAASGSTLAIYGDGGMLTASGANETLLAEGVGDQLYGGTDNSHLIANGADAQLHGVYGNNTFDATATPNEYSNGVNVYFSQFDLTDTIVTTPVANGDDYSGVENLIMEGVNISDLTVTLRDYTPTWSWDAWDEANQVDYTDTEGMGDVVIGVRGTGRSIDIGNVWDYVGFKSSGVVSEGFDSVLNIITQDSSAPSWGNPNDYSTYVYGDGHPVWEGLDVIANNGGFIYGG